MVASWYYLLMRYQYQLPRPQLSVPHTVIGRVQSRVIAVAYDVSGAVVEAIEPCLQPRDVQTARKLIAGLIAEVSWSVGCGDGRPVVWQL